MPKNLIAQAQDLPESAWKPLKRTQRTIKTTERAKPVNVKRQVIRKRGYVHLELEHEDVAEFEYKPTACHRGYRLLNWTDLTPAFFLLCDSLLICRTGGAVHLFFRSSKSANASHFCEPWQPFYFGVAKLSGIGSNRSPRRSETSNKPFRNSCKSSQRWNRKLVRRIFKLQNSKLKTNGCSGNRPSCRMIHDFLITSLGRS